VDARAVIRPDLEEERPVTGKNIADMLAEEAEHADQHRDDELTRGHRRAQPPKEPAQVYSLRIPADRLDQLRQLANERHTTPSALIRAWVLDRLDLEAAAADAGPGHGPIRFGYPLAHAMGSGRTESALALLDQTLRQLVRDELDRAGINEASRRRFRHQRLHREEIEAR